MTASKQTLGPGLGAPPPVEKSDAVEHGATSISRAVDTAARRELPPDMLEAGARRLGFMCLLNVGLLTTVLLLVVLLAPRDSELWREDFPLYWRILLPAVLLNLAMYVAATRCNLRPTLILALSRGYLVAYTLLLALLRHSEPWHQSDLLRHWSWGGVVIVLYAVLIPERPASILQWAIAAALTDPFALHVMLGRTGPPPAEQVLLLATPLFSVVLAYSCSRVIYGLTERIVAAREIGSYRLVEQLGVGGMGEVWRADHRMLARPAAIKLIRPAAFAGHGIEEARRLVKLFEREVQATATLTSPHTIQVYDFGVARDATFYYVMELLDGFDLQTLVKRFGRQPPERVAYLLRQACLSLHEAHSQKFVHRDLKPANLIACRYGGQVDHVKVLDFGLVMDRRPTVEELEEKGVTGTPAIMAPEMMRFGAPVDERADIYALGCVAYWLLTGERVFEAESRQDMLVMHAHQKPIAPSKRAHLDLPPGVDRLVLDCLAKNPNRRPQTANELGERLDELDVSRHWTRDRREGWWLRFGGEGHLASTSIRPAVEYLDQRHLNQPALSTPPSMSSADASSTGASATGAAPDAVSAENAPADLALPGPVRES